MTEPLLQSNIPGYPCKRGKVRDVYDLGEQLVIVATDRISAFDWVMPNGIPGKGELLTAMTRFWLDWLGVPHHLLSNDELPEAFQCVAERSMLVRKTEVVPIECVARGYLEGSGWKEYQQHGSVCGNPIPIHLRQADKLPEPIFTPATKAESGHDENITFKEMCDRIGKELAERLRDETLSIYERAAEYAAERGIIIADTKLEWGHLPSGELILIDEVLTPDSSRFWPMSEYRVGVSPPSFDKQFVRNWLETTDWDKNSPPPTLPEKIVQQTLAKYHEAFEILTSSTQD